MQKGMRIEYKCAFCIKVLLHFYTRGANPGGWGDTSPKDFDPPPINICFHLVPQ